MKTSSNFLANEIQTLDYANANHFMINPCYIFFFYVLLNCGRHISDICSISFYVISLGFI